jgi:hypothetical protein
MSLDDLSQAISAYRDGDMTLDSFEDWFRDDSRGMFGESPEVLEACLAIEAAFSMLRYSGDRSAFRQELANVVSPSVFSAYGEPIEIVVGKPQFRATSANRAFRVLASAR